MDSTLTEFLWEVEREEATLIAWGLVDGFFPAAEIEDQAIRFLDRTNAWDRYPDSIALLDELVDRRLLFRWYDGGFKYRSRMGEAVRLMARLRQLFPRHLNTPGGWVGSPTLVADFRFILRAREYPRRDIAAKTAIAHQFAEAARLTGLQRGVLEVLLGSSPNTEGAPLAGFQVRATTRILSEAANQVASGTMVCAGTGSGKTWAFYLPALTRLVGMLEKDSTQWTRALAIYPRNELLKDQLTETVRQVQRLKPLLRAHRVRPLQIGTFFGPTPRNPKDVVEPSYGKPWVPHDNGRVCPFLVCPTCARPMIWRDTDREQSIERLVCVAGDVTLEPEDVVLTRARLQREPADVLFTTTEMMNQRLTDAKHWHLFGVGQPSHRLPVLVLLDEAHTYNGAHGTQVAYLLRRWRHRSRAKPHFVGLSATLMEAAVFFAQLTGLGVAAVEEISPEPGELLKEGMEYMLALRGDPVSGASLLSTTIQAAMLLRRILDADDRISEGTFGQKVFVFTDDLDVTNRMYFNLLDAEGLDYAGRPDPTRHPGGSLATLRASTLADQSRRFIHGQSWQLCEDIGHNLDPTAYLRIGRVSSQDSGVDSAAELIVATASLEVGFNDPGVGAVLQHKAPRDSASFIQRKGRAGRARSMRPWTVVVLSDFGRDRLAYQGYDLMFDPELRPRELPLGNRHVQKMQAAYACLDWISAEIGSVGPGWFWLEASQPSDVGLSRKRQEVAANLIERVLAGGEETDRLRDWLRHALRLSDSEVEAVLWEAPRALMTGVLPTLHRRLATQWTFNNVQGGDYYSPSHPIPDFVPANLFSDLSLPEVQVWAAPGPRSEPEPHAMPVLNSLREFAPGRISRRFGIRHGSSRHWIPLDPQGSDPQAVDIASFCAEKERELIGEFSYRDGTEVRRIPVWRPYAITVRDDAPKSVKDSSQSFLRWHSQILAPEDSSAGQKIDLPANSPWVELLREIRFFTHLQHQPVRVRRFAHQAEARINLDHGQSSEITAQFMLAQGDGQASRPVALGYSLEVDAVRVRMAFPADWRLDNGTAEKLPALRAARFRWRVRQDEQLVIRTSIFERRWIADIALAGITANAIGSGLSLQEAWQALRNNSATLPLSVVLDVVFQTVASEADDGATRFEQDRLTDLRTLVGDDGILTALDDCVRELWDPVGTGWHTWLQDRFHATVAAAFREAVQQLCPDIDSDELLVDLDKGPDEAGLDATNAGTNEFWLSEDTPGGGGIVERLLPRLAEAPRRFLDLWKSALHESDFEHADHELTRFFKWIVDDQDAAILAELDTVRRAVSLESTSEAFRRLQRILLGRGLHTSHPVMTALATRFLKPGSTPRSDALVANLMRQWQSLERSLGVEIEVHSFAYAMSLSNELDTALSVSSLPLAAGQDRRTWRFNALCAILWPRGSHTRNHALPLRLTFADQPETERLLVTDVLGAAETEIDFLKTDWATECEKTLLREQRAAVLAPASMISELRVHFNHLLARPIDTGSLLVYPRLRGIERREDRIAVVLEVVTGGQVAPAEPEERETDSARLIVKTAKGNRDEVRDLLESLLAVELLASGDEVWIVSPWISDLGVLDNRAGKYSGLDSAWPKRHISLAEIFVFALRSNPDSRLHIVTRPDVHNIRFCDRLKTLATLENCSSRVLIDSNRPTLHTKGLVATTFALNGSMNFTRNGVEVLEETVQLETDPARIAQLRLALHGNYR